MTRRKPTLHRLARWAACMLMFASMGAWALQSDRQQPLEINADTTVGSLGDGRAELRGNVLIRQGSLLIKAELAEVEKVEGKVREIILTGAPVSLEQEIEQQGRVEATAARVEYQVATGMVTLTGEADVNHPQYKVSGEMLQYDLNAQHFQGSGTQDNGRIRIQLDPELIEDRQGNTPVPPPLEEAPGEDLPADETTNDDPPAEDPPAEDAPSAQGDDG